MGFRKLNGQNVKKRKNWILPFVRVIDTIYSQYLYIFICTLILMSIFFYLLRFLSRIRTFVLYPRTKDQGLNGLSVGRSRHTGSSRRGGL